MNNNKAALTLERRGRLPRILHMLYSASVAEVVGNGKAASTVADYFILAVTT